MSEYAVCPNCNCIEIDIIWISKWNQEKKTLTIEEKIFKEYKAFKELTEAEKAYRLGYTSTISNAKVNFVHQPVTIEDYTQIKATCKQCGYTVIIPIEQLKVMEEL